VTEVDTGFQHLTHCDCHEILREGWVLSRLPHPALIERDTLGAAGLSFDFRTKSLIRFR
jgi:hypothetical protein